MNYVVTHDHLGRAEIHGPVSNTHARTHIGQGRRRVPFKVENNKKLNGIFDDAIKLWMDAQKRWKHPFSFRAFMLAMVSASEYAEGSDQLKAAVQHAALNWERSNRFGYTLEKMLIPDGQFGGQLGRYAATSKPTTLRDVLIAEKVLANELQDPTEGAIQFDAPKTQRILHRIDPKTYKPPEIVAQERQDAGLRPVYLQNEDPQLARFWAPTVVAQL